MAPHTPDISNFVLSGTRFSGPNGFNISKLKLLLTSRVFCRVLNFYLCNRYNNRHENCKITINYSISDKSTISHKNNQLGNTG